jgi:hypothetical protein
MTFYPIGSHGQYAVGNADTWYTLEYSGGHHQYIRFLDSCILFLVSVGLSLPSCILCLFVLFLFPLRFSIAIRMPPVQVHDYSLASLVLSFFMLSGFLLLVFLRPLFEPALLWV